MPRVLFYTVRVKSAAAKAPIRPFFKWLACLALGTLILFAMVTGWHEILAELAKDVRDLLLLLVAFLAATWAFLKWTVPVVAVVIAGIYILGRLEDWEKEVRRYGRHQEETQREILESLQRIESAVDRISANRSRQDVPTLEEDP